MVEPKRNWDLHYEPISVANHCLVKFALWFMFFGVFVNIQSMCMHGLNDDGSNISVMNWEKVQWVRDSEAKCRHFVDSFISDWAWSLQFTLGNTSHAMKEACLTELPTLSCDKLWKSLPSNDLLLWSTTMKISTYCPKGDGSIGITNGHFDIIKDLRKTVESGGDGVMKISTLTPPPYLPPNQAIQLYCKMVWAHWIQVSIT